MAKFQLYRDTARQYRFRLRADNNEIVATSEAYTTKVAAENGIQVVRRISPAALTEDQT